MTTKKKRLTIEELQRMPKDKFPLQVKTNGLTYAHTVLETISILSGMRDNCGNLPIADSTGAYDIMSADNLKEYPSFETDEPEEIEWFQVAFTAKRGSGRPELSRFLYRSKEDFLSANYYIESDYHMIDLIPVKKYPNYSEVR